MKYGRGLAGGLLGLYAGISALALLKSPTPFGIIWGGGALLVAAAAWKWRRYRGIAVNVAVILLAFTGFEFYKVYGPTPDGGGPVSWFEGSYRNGQYFGKNDSVGNAPRPGIVCQSIKKNSHRVVYDVQYTIEPNGLRSTPQVPSGTPIALFFGDSFVFGEGLNDGETLPSQWVFASKQHSGALNFGFHGYGAQQALAYLESGRVAEIVADRPVKWVVLSTLPDHVLRTAGRYIFNSGTPRYVVKNGYLKRDGMYPNETIVGKVLRKSQVVRTVTRADVYAPATDSDFELYFQVVQAIRNRVKSQYGVELVILLWGENEANPDPNYQRILSGFKERKFRVIQVEPDVFGPNYVPEEMSIAGDGHPNATANRQVAQYLVRDMELGN